MTDDDWRRHERGAWLRWGIMVVIALSSAIIAGQCNVQAPQIPAPPQRGR